MVRGSGVAERATAVVSGLGLVLLAVPLYDIYDDAYTPPYKTLGSTLVENAIPALLALGLVAAGIWLGRQDWEPTHVRNVLRWTLGATGAYLFVFGWILGIQWFLQNDLKPVIIALDALVIGALAAFGIGVYNTRSKRQQARLADERDRLSALFANTNDCVAEVEATHDGLHLERRNGAFRQAIDDPESLLATVANYLVDESANSGVIEAVRANTSLERHLSLDTDDGQREYLLRVVPVSTGDSQARLYLVLTDITEQQRLAREIEAKERIEYLHSVATDLSNTTEHQTAYDLTLDAAAQSLGYDAACLAIDGSLVATRETETLLDRHAVETQDTNGAPSIGVDGGSTLRETDIGWVLTARVGDYGVLQLLRESDSFDEYAVTAAELLTTHLRETLERLDREQALGEERERLEFINRIFRHDLLDGMNVLVTHVELLRSHVDDDGQEYLEVVTSRVDRMVDLIRTMRSLTDIVTSDADHELYPIPLRDVLFEEIKKAREGFDSDVSIDVDDVPQVMVEADGLLSEVFRNVLTNAVEHNHAESPHIEITTDTSDDAVAVRIADNGPGIPDERKAEIFEKGEKGGESSGTGIGLYLVDELVSTYGGTIEVEDSDMGGAAFHITLHRTD